MYCYQYPHPTVTVDCVVFGLDEGNLSVLLIQRDLDPFQGARALPGVRPPAVLPHRVGHLELAGSARGTRLRIGARPRRSVKTLSEKRHQSSPP